MCRRVRVTHVIDRLHQPAPHKRTPKSIHNSLGKIGIVSSGQPVNQILSTILRLIFQIILTGNPSQGGFPCAGVNHLSGCPDPNDLRILDFRKNRGQSVIIVLGPLVQWMIVAIRTPQATSHEQFTYKLGLFARPIHSSVEISGSDVVGVTRRQN